MKNFPAAKKSLGQHFLTDPAICFRIARLLEMQPEDQIIEIGPGAGALTEALKSLPHSFLLLLEKDSWWSLEQARKNIPDTSVINIDALTFPWHGLEKYGKWKIAGNLPYNVASPLIWDIISQCKTLQKAVFMVQKEVAARITATPSNKAYGALTAWIRNFSHPRLEFNLAPGAFSPPPKVNSSVVSFLPKKKLPKNPDHLKRLLALCFQKRRKQMGTIFQQAQMPWLADAMQKMGLCLKTRPENLSPEEFCELANHWQKPGIS